MLAANMKKPILGLEYLFSKCLLDDEDNFPRNFIKRPFILFLCHQAMI